MVHIILHVALCGAMSAASPQTTLPVHVVVSDPTGAKNVDKTFAIERGYDDQKLVEFDMERGTYRLQVTGRPKFACGADTFVQVLPDVDRSISVQLQSPDSGLGQPLLIAGKAPQSFLYAKPTYVLLDPHTQCNAPIGTPLPASIEVDNQRDAYYATIESTLPQAMLAMRLKTASSQYHFVRLNIPYPLPWAGFPSTVHFDVTEDMLDELAGKPVNTLLYPRLWRTSTS